MTWPVADSVPRLGSRGHLESPPSQVAGAALRPMLLKLQSQLPDRPAAAELDADAVDIVGNDMCVCARVWCRS